MASLLPSITELIGMVYNWAGPIINAFAPIVWYLIGISLGIIVIKGIIDWFSAEADDFMYAQEEKRHTKEFLSSIENDVEPSGFLSPQIGKFFGNLRTNLTQHDTGILFRNRDVDDRNKRFEKYQKYAAEEDKKREQRYKMYSESKYNTPENDRA